MAVHISEAYRPLRDVALETLGYDFDTVEISREIRDAGTELAEDQNRFERNLKDLEAAIANDRTSLDEEPIKLRISAMNISTIFSNLADEIENVVVCRVRNAT